MRVLLAYLLLCVALAWGARTAQARVAYADSDVFAIDTVTSVEDPSDRLPSATRLASIYPNPFNPSTTIAFDLATDGRVDLAIFDVRGRLVSIVESAPMSAGRHQTIWHGQDREGRGVPSGTYFCRLIAGGQTQTMKLLLAR